MYDIIADKRRLVPFFSIQRKYIIKNGHNWNVIFKSVISIYQYYLWDICNIVNYESVIIPLLEFIVNDVGCVKANSIDKSNMYTNKCHIYMSYMYVYIC